MARSRYIYSGSKLVAEYQNGELVFMDEDYYGVKPTSSVMIAPDLPDVVSPIDGKVISGRAGLREHCRRHDVVPTEDLKGLPPKLMNQEYKVSPQERLETKRFMSYVIDKMERK